MYNFVCSIWSPAIAFILGLAVIIEMIREYREVKWLDLHLQSLIDDVGQAQDNLNNANEDYINIATYELMAAEDKLNVYIREQKLEKIRKKTFQPPTEKVK